MKKKDKLAELGKMFALLEAYVDFYNLSLNAECAKHEITFKDAESLSGFCNFFAKTLNIPNKTSPNDFMHKQEAYVNDTIEYYNSYKEKLDNGINKGLSRRAVDGFCKHVYYHLNDSSGNCMKLRILPTDFIEIPNVIWYYMMYKNGFITKQNLENYQWIEFFSKKKIDRTLLKRIIRTVRQAEKLYNEIEFKVEERFLKDLFNK